MINVNSDARSAIVPNPSTVIDLLRRNAFHQKDRLAYTFLVEGEAEKVEMTYEDLDRRSSAIGAALQLAGATGECVLILCPPGLEFIAAFLGCLYAGAIAVPAYPPKLNRSQLRLQGIIEDSQAAMVLTTKAVMAGAERVFSEAPYAKNLRWLAIDDIPSHLEMKWREPAINGDTLAMLQYTSGSTSAPKGVMVSHSNLLRNVRIIQEATRQTADSVFVGWLPLYHDMGLIGIMLHSLFLGARCILMSPTAFLQKPSRWLQALALENNRAILAGGGQEKGRHLVGCGNTPADQRIAIVQPDRLTECSEGEVGEIWVSGPCVAQGYWRRHQQTEQIFRAYLPRTGEGPFLRTGDLGFILEGELFVTGRLKDLIIIDGQNHYPQDIELTVERSHSALRPGCCAAFSIDCGGREQLVVAAELDRHYRDPDQSEIVKAVRQAVAEQHELRVERVWFLKMGGVPKTSSGKIQRHLARADFLSTLTNNSNQE